MKYRRAAKVDTNQNDIVDELRSIVGITVAVGHDDILVGYMGKTFWFEIKRKEVLSRKTGQVRNSSVKKSQKKLKATWEGHYSIVCTTNEILEQIGYEFGV